MLCREQPQGCWVDHWSPWSTSHHQLHHQSGRWRTSCWWTPKISASLLLLYRCLAEAQVRVHLLVSAHLVLPRKPLLNRCFPFSIIREASEELHIPCWKIWKPVCSCHLSQRGCLVTTWCWRSWTVLWILFCSVPTTCAFFIIIV